jgi:hypothetical protein
MGRKMRSDSLGSCGWPLLPTKGDRVGTDWEGQPDQVDCISQGRRIDDRCANDPKKDLLLSKLTHVHCGTTQPRGKAASPFRSERNSAGHAAKRMFLDAQLFGI